VLFSVPGQPGVYAKPQDGTLIKIVMGPADIACEQPSHLEHQYKATRLTAFSSLKLYFRVRNNYQILWDSKKCPAFSCTKIDFC